MKKIMGMSYLRLINEQLVISSHDVSDGGMIVALSEMAIGSNYGVKVEKPKIFENLIEYFFGEDQGRYILEVEQKKIVEIEKF